MDVNNKGHGSITLRDIVNLLRNSSYFTNKNKQEARAETKCRQEEGKWMIKK
jgi:hypothetical protein